MIHRIFVSTKIDNTKALIKKKELDSLCIRGTIKDVYLVEVYSIDKNFNRKDLEKISLSLINSISQSAVIDKIPTHKQFSYCWKVGFLPGVTDKGRITILYKKESLSYTIFSQ